MEKSWKPSTINLHWKGEMIYDSFFGDCLKVFFMFINFYEIKGADLEY